MQRTGFICWSMLEPKVTYGPVSLEQLGQFMLQLYGASKGAAQAILKLKDMFPTTRTLK